MRRYANADGDEHWYKTSKTQVSFAFCKIMIVVEYKLTTYTVCAVVVGNDCSTNHSSADRIVVISYN